ncbi:MAG: rRNA pseudouridine synthase [Armatimonadetes bacterium]|nr:rRNA pseudouridine synthase [Armatimonadota bacterium]
MPLQRALARAGVASRRKGEALIREGKVTVDGKTAELGQRVAPLRQEIAVEGQPIALPQAHEYLMLNKPRGYLTSRADPRGRPLVFDLLRDVDRPRLVAVGRLDRDTEGLLLFTTDGALAHRLMHPRYQVPRVYRLEASGPGEAIEALRAGCELDDGFAKPDAVRVLARRGQRVELELTLHEGRKREVRRLAKACGLVVHRLQRLALGPLRLGNLPLGHWRRLRAEEIRALRRAAGMSS